MEIAASRSPAAQPSARVVRHSSESGGKVMSCCAMSRPDSGTLNASLSARISVSSPASRNRCSGSSGSMREATITRRPCGAFRSR